MRGKDLMKVMLPWFDFGDGVPKNERQVFAGVFLCCASIGVDVCGRALALIAGLAREPIIAGIWIRVCDTSDRNVLSSVETIGYGKGRWRGEAPLLRSGCPLPSCGSDRRNHCLGLIFWPR